MKHITLTLGVAAAALFTLPSITAAQDQPAGAPPAHADGAGRGGPHFTPAERLKHMTETLGLTQEQQDKIKAIFEKNAPAIKELRSKGFQNLTDADKTKMRELVKAEMEDIAAVLTPEQKAKMKAEMEKRREGWKGGQRKPGATPPATTPAPATE